VAFFLSIRDAEEERRDWKVTGGEKREKSGRSDKGNTLDWKSQIHADTHAGKG